MRYLTRANGFTLVEVVVALAVLATTLYSGFFLMQRSTINARHLQDTVLANWVASDAFAELVISGTDLDDESTREQAVEIYGERFLVFTSEQALNADNSGEGSEQIAEGAKFRIQVAKQDNPGLYLEDFSFNR